LSSPNRSMKGNRSQESFGFYGTAGGNKDSLPSLARLNDATGKSVIESYKNTVTAAPAIGFGSALRGNINANTIDSPGPGAYSMHSSLQPNNPNSLIKSTPQFSLRGREKFGSPITKAIDPTTIREPGPGHYNSRVVNPREKQAPKYSFARDTRSKALHPAFQTPGPGAYSSTQAVGKQVLSTKQTMRQADFGLGDRPALMTQSAAEVGPGEYTDPVGSCMRQVDSRKKTVPTTKFGKAARDGPVIGARNINDHTASPGPGSYRLPSGLCGGGASHPYKAAPAASLSGRTKFGSPF